MQNRRLLPVAQGGTRLNLSEQRTSCERNERDEALHHPWMTGRSLAEPARVCQSKTQVGAELGHGKG